MCDQVFVDEYEFACCPEGTYVRRRGQLLSFKPERDLQCPQRLVQKVNKDPYEWIVTVSIVITICIVVMYIAMFILHYYQKKRPRTNRYGRSVRMRQDQGVGQSVVISQPQN